MINDFEKEVDVLYEQAKQLKGLLQCEKKKNNWKLKHKSQVSKLSIQVSHSTPLSLAMNWYRPEFRYGNEIVGGGKIIRKKGFKYNVTVLKRYAPEHTHNLIDEIESEFAIIRKKVHLMREIITNQKRLDALSL